MLPCLGPGPKECRVLQRLRSLGHRLEPGLFKLSEMTSFSTKGVSERITYMEALDEQHRQLQQGNLCAMKISGFWQLASKI